MLIPSQQKKTISPIRTRILERQNPAISSSIQPRLWQTTSFFHCSAQVSISCFSSTISSSHAVLHFLGFRFDGSVQGFNETLRRTGVFWRNLLCGNARNATFWAVCIPWAPPKPWKNKSFGPPKNQVIYHKFVGFGGAMVASHTWWNSNICDGISGSFFRYLSHPKGLKTASLLLEKWLPTPTVERKSMKSQWSKTYPMTDFNGIGIYLLCTYVYGWFFHGFSCST